MDDVTGVYPAQREAHDQLVHEFKNHLAVIVGFCDLLLSEMPDDDPRRADLEQMHQAGHAAVALLPKLLSTDTRSR